MEIERKFLVKQIPFPLDNISYKHIEQGYISYDPTIRIRRMDDSFFLTMKSRGTLVRQEYEMSITAMEYSNLLKKVDSYIITKRRYFISLNQVLTAELDVFEGQYEGLKLVEVEFDSVEEANAFSPPSWFGKEVTEDYRYTNVSMAYNKNGY